MYGLMITFHSSIPTADLVDPFTSTRRHCGSVQD